jgi:hypothetical protein
MTEYGGAEPATVQVLVPEPPAPAAPHRWQAAFIAGVLTFAGAPVGALWAWWSPDRPFARVVDIHQFWGLFDVATVYPEESEAWAAGDGRFAALMALVGLVAALVVWHLPLQRGTWPIGGLTVGALLGSLVAGIVGFAVGGGDASGATDSIIRSALWVHTYALYLVQALVAVLVYGLFVAFAARDDLGR